MKSGGPRGRLSKNILGEGYVKLHSTFRKERLLYSRRMIPNIAGRHQSLGTVKRFGPCSAWIAKYSARQTEIRALSTPWMRGPLRDKQSFRGSMHWSSVRERSQSLVASFDLLLRRYKIFAGYYALTAVDPSLHRLVTLPTK